MEEIKQAIILACKKQFGVEVEADLSRPAEEFGDYATNIALQLSKKFGKNPHDIATSLVAELKSPLIAKTDVAGPGFINIWLTDEALTKTALAATELSKPFAGQQVVTEYSDPNPFKVLHAGHFYTSVVGDAIAKLFEAGGAQVHRVNFGGDVGLHVAKTMWAILQELGGEQPEKLSKIKASERPQWLAKMYVAGNKAHDENSEAKQAMQELNKRIYDLVEKDDKSSALAEIYWQTRQWSYDYFNWFYQLIGTKFEKYYPESQTVKPGLKAVKANMGKVFEESDGAVVFKGEVHNLHTRVFISSQGLPTYETKDVGLILSKWQDYHFDKSIVITGNEIYEYMQVVLKAVEQFEPKLVERTTHITHGIVKLSGGVRMKSREGNIVQAVDVLREAKTAAEQAHRGTGDIVALGAIKYAFLKQRLGGDIIYEPKESVSLQGNSGPYLQYAHARARSILTKAKPGKITDLDVSERSLARQISQFPEVVEAATIELMPSHICSYLYQLAQVFNRFYENSRVAADKREGTRASLVEAYAHVLKSGLGLLNIDAPDKI